MAVDKQRWEVPNTFVEAPLVTVKYGHWGGGRLYKSKPRSLGKRKCKSGNNAAWQDEKAKHQIMSEVLQVCYNSCIIRSLFHFKELQYCFSALKVGCHGFITLSDERKAGRVING